MKKVIVLSLTLLLISIHLFSNEKPDKTLNPINQGSTQTQIQVIERSDDILGLEIPDSTQTQIMKIDEGSSFIGRIIEIDDEKIKFKTKHGIMTVSIFEIAEIKIISDDQIKEGKYWFPNPNSSRLFFAPTGRMLKKGEGYFADYFIFFPTVTFGITDNITLGGGFSIVPGLDPFEQVLLFTPKIGVKTSKRMDLAFGALVVKLPEDAPSAGILYGVSTFGSLDKSITIGLGYGYVKDDFADRPIVVLGGETRTSKSISLVTENWIVPEKDTPVLSFGLRFFGEKVSADFALIFPLEDDVITFPYIDFVYKF
jgi:hypothetical protein